MSRLTDRIEQLEYDLAKYPGDDRSDLLSRRLALRRHLNEWGHERYDEGHRDGMRDVSDTRSEAERRADETAATAGED
jgi:hypothetical protein